MTLTQHFVKVFPPSWTAIPITVNLKWQIPNDVWRKPSPSVTKSKFKVTPYYYYFIIFSTSVLVECSNLIILHRPWPEPLQHLWEEEECKIRASTSHPTAVPDLFWLNGQKNSHWHAAKPSGNGFQKAAAKGFGVRCPKSSQSGVYFIFFFFQNRTSALNIGLNTSKLCFHSDAALCSHGQTAKTQSGYDLPRSSAWFQYCLYSLWLKVTLCLQCCWLASECYKLKDWPLTKSAIAARSTTGGEKKHLVLDL